MKIQLAGYRMAAHAFTAVLDVLSIRYLLEMSRIFACGDKEIHGTNAAEAAPRCNLIDRFPKAFPHLSLNQ